MLDRQLSSVFYCAFPLSAMLKYGRLVTLWGFIMYYLTSCSGILHSTIKHIVTRLATVWTVTLPDLNATVVLVDNPIWTILGRARYWLIWKAAHEHTLCPYIMLGPV